MRKTRDVDHGRARWLLAPPGLLAVAMIPFLAGPPAERTVVTAVADADANRILVRWLVEEGTPRYTLFDLLRRKADEIEFTQLNAEPILPLTDVDAIEAVFTAPGRADALAEIVEQFGDAYAAELARLQRPDAPPQAAMQLRLLPEWNYCAALALGRGWLDETVTPGDTYVYELWGLDPLGFRAERLGRATATALEATPLPAPTGVRCVERRGIAGDLTADLRWTASETVQPFLGYEVLRVQRSPVPDCPFSAALRANRLPVLGAAPGRVAEGATLFAAADCTACHPGGRDNVQIAGSTIEDFRRKQYPPQLPCPGGAPHDTPELNALDIEDVRAIYDYIHESQYTDDGSGTPANPLEAGAEYCYWVAARDLLGQLGVPSDPPAICTVADRRPPPVPLGLRSSQVLSTQGNWQTCEVSWRRSGDGDTTEYAVFRATEVPRNHCTEPVLDDDTPIVTEPDVGDRVVWSDDGPVDGLKEGDAGQPFFYAARALDAAGNASGFSGWVPCTPRDIVRPSQTVITIGSCPTTCPPTSQCRDRRVDLDWLGGGGDPLCVVSDPVECPVTISSSWPDDTRFVRSYRCMSDDPAGCLAGPDRHVDPFLDALTPILDTKVYIATRAFDRSGNVGDLSELEPLVIAGAQPIPAPRIISARLIDETTNKYKIRFRSIDPAALIGFALYASTQEPGVEVVPELRGFHVISLPGGDGGNLGDSLSEGDEVYWIVKSDAATLDQVLDTQPPTEDPYLIYVDDRVYEMVTDVIGLGVPISPPVRFYLAGVGWSGREGLAAPFVASGLELADGTLDWPRHPERNPDLPPPPDGPDLSIQLTPVGGANPYMRVVWIPEPPCSDTDWVDAPFALFRRRDNAARWQQLSPLFTCWSHAPIEELEYHDQDVQEGHWYSYTLLRLDRQGEFHRQHGPTDFTCFDTADPGTCTTPQPGDP